MSDIKYIGGRKAVIVRQILTSKGSCSYCVYDFIKEIRIRPVIWHKKHIDHRNKAAVEEAYRSVCLVLIPYFDQLKEKEQKDIVATLVKHWECTVKHLLASIRDGSRPYHYARQMEFILKAKNIKLENVFDAKTLEELDIKSKALQKEAVDKINAMEKKVGTKNKNDDNLKVLAIVRQLRKDLGDNDDNDQGDNDDGDGDDDDGNDDDDDGNEENAVSSSKRFKTADHNDDHISTLEVSNEPQYDYRQRHQTKNTKMQSVAALTSPMRRDADQPFFDPINPMLRKTSTIIRDTDQPFFDSIKPMLRKMTETQKLDFKIEVLQFLKKCQNV